jgi:hypothetical protein
MTPTDRARSDRAEPLALHRQARPEGRRVGRVLRRPP